MTDKRFIRWCCAQKRRCMERAWNYPFRDQEFPNRGFLGRDGSPCHWQYLKQIKIGASLSIVPAVNVGEAWHSFMYAGSVKLLTSLVI
jgi:hypothetical protein